MYEHGFRRWMEADKMRWGNPDSIDSYISGCNQVERRGGIDLDVEHQRDRLDGVLATLERAIEHGGEDWPAPKTLKNYRSHVDAYAQFRAERV